MLGSGPSFIAAARSAPASRPETVKAERRVWAEKRVAMDTELL